VFHEGPLTAQLRRDLRLFNDPRKPRGAPPLEQKLENDPFVWMPADDQMYLFSGLGAVLAVRSPAELPGQLRGLRGMFDQHYLYTWTLVEHQRLLLLSLTEGCAMSSRDVQSQDGDHLRHRLLEYMTRFDYTSITDEERQQRFYAKLREVLEVRTVAEEVQKAVDALADHLASKRGDMLNQVLAFLTLVLTPVGLWVGIFQTGTLPPADGPLAFRDLASAEWWSRLAVHLPFWLVVATALVGTMIYVRLVGTPHVREMLGHVVSWSTKRLPGANERRRP
jgi:hypothetical protein